MSKPETHQGYSALCHKCLLLRILACTLWALSMLFLSLTPDPPQISGPLGWDKLNHALAYGLLAFLLARCFSQWRGRDADITWPVWLIAMGYGVLLEILQLTMEAGRTFEWLDILADGVGISLVCVLLRHNWVRKFVQAREFNSPQ